VSTIAYDAGFNDLATFNRRFLKLMGATPSAFRAA
jgi:AraC-like DNA-binding protein